MEFFPIWWHNLVNVRRFVLCMALVLSFSNWCGFGFNSIPIICLYSSEWFHFHHHINFQSTCLYRQIARMELFFRRTFTSRTITNIVVKMELFDNLIIVRIKQSVIPIVLMTNWATNTPNLVVVKKHSHSRYWCRWGQCCSKKLKTNKAIVQGSFQQHVIRLKINFNDRDYTLTPIELSWLQIQRLTQWNVMPPLGTTTIIAKKSDNNKAIITPKMERLFSTFNIIK